MARRSTKMSLGLFLVVLAVVLCNLMDTTSVSARYLPTRADDTEIEILKDLIRGLLTRSRLQADQSAAAEPAGGPFQMGAGGGHWHASSHRQQPIEAAQRRSAMGGAAPLAGGGEEAAGPPASAFYGNNPVAGDDR